MPENNRAAVLLFAGLTLFAIPAAFAQEDAAKLDQAKRRFALADAALSKTFDALRKRLRANEFRDLRDRQRKWLEYRDYIASDQPRQNGFEGSDLKESPDYWEAMADLTKSRTEFLRAAFDEVLPKGITGVYQDSYGGELKLEETPKGVAFSINVVRGPTLHTGGLTGVATRKRNAAMYKEQVEEGEDRQPCELTFTFIDGHIVKLEGKNTEHYHGARAYFIGTYFKVAALDKPIDLESAGD
ncbi:MAG TPA: lysozyme inhibitor LprI family protein [Chthoniobacterales bacterium]|nr:lysozyme inhibitor LprI family protein [Chthoniobacterales bacterium]